MTHNEIIYRLNEHQYGPWYGVSFEKLETALFDAVGNDSALIAEALTELVDPEESTDMGLREMLAMLVDEDTYWSIVSRS